jgi:hypothetical protein
MRAGQNDLRRAASNFVSRRGGGVTVAKALNQPLLELDLLFVIAASVPLQYSEPDD